MCRPTAPSLLWSQRHFVPHLPLPNGLAAWLPTGCATNLEKRLLIRLILSYLNVIPQDDTP